MKDEQHGSTTTCENGVVPALPATDPEACIQTSLYTNFVGWTEDQIGTFATNEPTLIHENDRITADAIYYAVFKHTTADKWRTSCPDYNTITYQAGTGSGSDYVVYAETASSTTPSAATAGMSKDGYTLAGWTCPDYNSGAIVNPGAGLSGISSDLTFTAVWARNITITAPNGVWLTSYNDVQYHYKYGSKRWCNRC